MRFIYVCKLKSYGIDLKFTFYYLLQVPGFHSRVCFTLTVADPLQVVSSVFLYKKTGLSLDGEKGDRQLKLLPENFKSHNQGCDAALQLFSSLCLRMRKSFIVYVLAL